MIINETTTIIDKANFASTNFSLQADATLFGLLTSKVYNDTIAAAIREVSCNAVDSTIEAQNAGKYEVHLPTPTELHFSVRDYGTGISPEKMHSLYSVMGASSKRHSNDYTGALGIGKLSPLAYTSSFTIQSFYQGISYSYVVTKDAGIPSLIDVGSCPTSEPNGVKVSFPVQASDIHKFHNRAVKLYKYFEHKPTLNIELDIAFPSSDLVFPKWFQDETLPSKYNNYVLMSNVLYKIDSYDINTQDFNQLVIRADNGDVTINPGRESLSYDRKTIDYLNKCFSDILSEYSDFVTTTINEQPTTYSKLTMLDKATSNIPRKVAISVRKAVYDSNSDISALFTIDRNYSSLYSIETEPTNIAFKFKHKGYTNPKSFANMYGLNPSHFINSSILIIDQATNFSHAYLEFDSDILILTRPQGLALDLFVPIATQWCTDLGIPYSLSSSFTAPERESKSQNRTADIYVSTITSSGSISQSHQATPDLNYVYFELSGTSFIDDESITKPILIAHSYIYQTNSSYRLVGVPKKYLTAVKQATNFTPVLDFFKSEIPKHTFKVRSNFDSYCGTKLKNPPPLIASFYQTIQDCQTFHKSAYLYSENFQALLSLFPNATSVTFTPTTTKQDVIARYPDYFNFADTLSKYDSKSYQSLLSRYVQLEDFYYDSTHQADQQSDSNSNP